VTVNEALELCALRYYLVKRTLEPRYFNVHATYIFLYSLDGIDYVRDLRVGGNSSVVEEKFGTWAFRRFEDGNSTVYWTKSTVPVVNQYGNLPYNEQSSLARKHCEDSGLRLS
jgi:hypothetical protein